MAGITEVKAGNYTVRGISVAGVYTCLQIPELGVVLDAGIPLRAFAGGDNFFLSHGHADHLGGLIGMLGIRGMMNKPELPRLFMPKAIQADLNQALAHITKIQRYDLSVQGVGVEAGDEHVVAGSLLVRAFQTHHPVPSVGYQFFRRAKKLKAEFLHLEGAEIGRRRKAGEALFDDEEQLEVAYATDTLLRVLDTSPSILRSKVLILECSFLDERKDLAASQAGCHIHLDELLERAGEFQNEHLVLMHFSQIYKPAETHAILKRRLPQQLWERTRVFAPEHGSWF